MKMMKINILRRVAMTTVALAISASAVCAQIGEQADRLTYSGRIGYEVGASTPLGMPESIRGLNSYNPRANIIIGAGAHCRISSSWGIEVFMQVENKGMRTDAKVKNYFMEFRQGQDALKGVFTGNVVTEVDEWMISVPVTATFDVRKVRVKAGPYVSFLLNGEFSGYAYDGYIRKGTPIGAKVIIGDDKNTRGDYDFSDSMRKCHFGLMADANWRFGKNLGAFIGLSWGLTGIFHSDFKTVEQTMYPIYGSLGISYDF